MAHDYFRLFFGDGDFGVAYETSDDDSWVIEDRARAGAWVPLEFERREDEFPGPLGEFANGVSVDRLCAPRLRAVIDSYRTSADTYKWYDAFVTDHDGVRRPYFVMLFHEPPDVLNLDETTFAEGVDVLIRPVLSKEKISDRTIFNIPGLEIATVVRSDLKQAIEAAGIAGVEFSPIPVR